MKVFTRALITLAFATLPLAAAVCPVTPNTNSDCGYLLTIGLGDVITGAPVAGANPYDGSDDALVGVINNSGAVYTGSFTLTGSGNGGGIFGFDGDGICTFTSAAYCASAPTGYEGPINTFSNINAAGTSGSVNITGLGIGGSTFFSLEGSPASIGTGVIVASGTPEPGTIPMLALGLVFVGSYLKKRKK